MEEWRRGGFAAVGEELGGGLRMGEKCDKGGGRLAGGTVEGVEIDREALLNSLSPTAQVSWH